MAFQYIEAPNNDNIENEETLFLAGGISGVWNWQDELIKSLQEFNHLTVLNPRRENFEIFKNNSNFKESTIQIEWEYKYIRLAKQVVFWFSYETVQPIALYELGAAMERNNQKIIVGCDERYSRLFDVRIQLSLKGYPSHQIYNSFDKFVESVVTQQKNIKWVNELKLKR